MGLSEAPEGRPLDQNGCPIPSPVEVEQAAILKATIARENAAYEQGFAGDNSNRAREEAGERKRGRSR